MTKIKVAVGLSGGVDSAVSAYLLKKQGFDISGCYLHCFDDDEPGCRGKQDRQDALKVAVHLKIPFRVLDFRRQYKSSVIAYFKKEYLAGRTPNPDVVCNRDIKFGLLLDWCIKNRFDYLATGHYADVAEILPGQNFAATPAPANDRSMSRASNEGKANAKTWLGATPILRIPKDLHKDQTYFLWAVPKEKFRRVLFPLANFTKKHTRSVAKLSKIPVADKPDSTGICFIGEVRVGDFLKRLGVKEKKGEVVIRKKMATMAEMAKNGYNHSNHSNHSSHSSPFIHYQIVGSHRGVWFYTIGQRHGFQITNWPPVSLSLRGASRRATWQSSEAIQDKPVFYVIEKDIKKNRLVVGFGAECYRSQFTVSQINWLSDHGPWTIDHRQETGRRPSSKVYRLSSIYVRLRHCGGLIPCSVISSPFSVFSSESAGCQSAGLKPTNRKPTNHKLKTDNRELITVFLSIPQRGIAPGQSAVFYSKEGMVLGGGVIK